MRSCSPPGAEEAVAGGGATASIALDAPPWTRRAEPFSWHDRAYPAVPRPDLPWAWIRPRRLLFWLDLAAATVVVAIFTRVPHLMPFADELAPGGQRTSLFFIVLTVATLLLMMARDRTYSSSDRLSRIDDGMRLIKNILYTGIVVGSVALLTHGVRGVLDRDVVCASLCAVGVFYVFLTTNRVAMWNWQRRMFVRGEGLRRVVVLGVEREAAAFKDFIQERPWLGLRLVGGVRVSSGRTTRVRTAPFRPSGACSAG